MGTTAEKLSYLNETKTKIKNALETPYNVFRDYPAMIKKYIDNQPTKIVTNGICDNAVELPIVSLKSDGNSEQKTTEGYNLLQNIVHKDDESYTVNGVTFTKNSDGSIVANGNATETARYYLVGEGSQQRAEIKIGTYRATGCPSGGSLSTYEMAWGITGLGEKHDLGNGINITLSSDTTYYFVIKIVKGQTVNNLVFKPMIINGTAEKSYEPYTGSTPSPNPDYPQDVEVIDGYNKLDFKTMLKNADAEFTESKGVFTISSRRMLYNKPFKLNLKPNYTYTMYQEYQMQETPNLRLEILKGETYDVVATSWTLKEDLQDRKITFTTDENSNYYIRGNWGAAVEPLIYNQPILVEGTELKPYLPYGYIGLEQSGKNKVDNKVQAQLINNAKEITLDENKRITLTQATYSYAVFKIKQNISEYAGKTVRLKADFTKSNSNLNPKYGVLLGDANYSEGRQLMGESPVSGYTINFNLPSIFENGEEYLYIRLYATVNKEGNIDDYVDFNNIILTIDNEDMAYEPYHETKVIPINLQGNTLAKVGSIKDKPIIHRNGEVELEKKVRKYVFTGEELWNQSSYGEKSWILPVSYVSAEKTNSTMNVISNIFNGVSSDDRSKELKNKIYTDNSSGAIVIRDTQLTTLEDVRVATKDNYIYYKLITPQTIKLPSIEPIKLWQGTNIFKLITNLETNFEVEYVVDKDSMLDEVQTAMLNAEIEI